MNDLIRAGLRDLAEAAPPADDLVGKAYRARARLRKRRTAAVAGMAGFLVGVLIVGVPYGLRGAGVRTDAVPSATSGSVPIPAVRVSPWTPLNPSDRLAGTYFYFDIDDAGTTRVYSWAGGKDGLTTLFEAPGNPGLVAVSPDGTRLAWVEWTTGALMVTDTGGRPARQVAQSAAGNRCAIPAWSPDSAHLLYVGTDGLYTVGSDGRDGGRVISGQVCSPAWSVDGSAVAYVEQGRIMVGRAGGGTFHAVSLPKDDRFTAINALGSLSANGVQVTANWIPPDQPHRDGRLTVCGTQVFDTGTGRLDLSHHTGWCGAQFMPDGSVLVRDRPDSSRPELVLWAGPDFSAGELATLDEPAAAHGKGLLLFVPKK